MKILTAAQMREVDRRTIELGIPALILMENAGDRVVEFLAERFAPLSNHRIAVFCGKGNNGGDGLVVARQLFTRFRCRALHIVLAAAPEDLHGEAAQNLQMLRACGCPFQAEITAETRLATIVVDALLGTGASGPATGRILAAIRDINTCFAAAKIVSVDIPSGMPSDTGQALGEMVRADYTITFTAPKVAQVLPPNCDRAGELRVRAIGSPPELFENDDTLFLSLITRAQFQPLLASREEGANKGKFGHVMVLAGSREKTGAAAMAGVAGLRAGAGLVTVCSAQTAVPIIASHAPELMIEALPEIEAGAISLRAFDYGRLQGIAEKKTVLAIGPGLGTHPETIGVVQRVVAEFSQPMVIDADGLNALADAEWSAGERLRVLTPHPGEMARLVKKSVAEVQADRVLVARNFALERKVCLVLKGQRTLIAFPGGRVWVNPTGTPAMAKGGTGDILTGLIAGFLAQFPEATEQAIAAAVYLHGLSGQLGSAELGDKALLATDLLRYLPAAMHECKILSDQL